ncbi:uncharacterized protein LOC124120914 [Haliotis rufescens]|uniref:uncharacterized protein LOC124120914 n=1 Tax=Haliotis rufescens TaxID=6454 RepID=UPI00201EBF48|nr:uncharacterized protein LOC124120914 [Haliotis rufescens]
MRGVFQSFYRWFLLFISVGLLALVLLNNAPQWTLTRFADNGGESKNATPRVTLKKENPILRPHDNEEVRFEDLFVDYTARIQTMKDGGLWKSNPPTKTCDKVTGTSTPCEDTKCVGNVTSDPKESLTNVLKSMADLDSDTLAEVTRLLQPSNTAKKVVFVTAASTNHFLESQALIKNLHENVFPLLTNYSFVYYDLGLTTEQRSKVERFCRCDVRTFPLWAMPPRLRKLTCYTWKPLIINANLPTAEKLVWADASVRFQGDSILTLLKELDVKGVAISRADWSIGQHTTPSMMDYFGEKNCKFSNIVEPGAFFIMFKNDRFIRHAVVKPWVACALSPNCMCPDKHEKLLHCRGEVRKYSKCHRFDQSAIGIILVKLFRGHEVSVTLPPKAIRVRRGNKENYFDALQSRVTPKLFKNYV